jgi:hypothetical protein
LLTICVVVAPLLALPDADERKLLRGLPPLSVNVHRHIVTQVTRFYP